MKTDTSMNLMLVVFCVILIGFVLLNTHMSETLGKKQADLEHRTEATR
jgi:preprotein translocase subunit SecG